MFNLFKRTPVPVKEERRPTVARQTATKPTAGRRAFDPLAPLPVPDVAEGNTEADWSAWEDSVAFQDSVMPQFAPANTKPVPTQPSALTEEEVDSVFARIHKNTS